MIIKTLEELEPYRQLTVRDDVEVLVSGRGSSSAKKVYRNLIDTEELVRMEYGENLPYYIAKSHHIDGKSFYQLARELGLRPRTLRSLLDDLSIPKLSNKEALSRYHRLNPELSRENGRNSYEFGLGRLSRDERVEIGKKAYEFGLGRMSHEEHVKAGEIGGKLTGKKNYESGKSGLCHVDHVKIGKASGRKVFEEGLGIHNPKRKNEYLPTIHGQRIDVPYDAKSAYEANIYRLLTYLGFQIEHDIPIELKVDDSRNYIFKSATTTFVVDFKAISPDGTEYLYEICASHNEDPRGLEQILMFNEQYPNRKLIVVTGNRFDGRNFPCEALSYKALEREFATAINQSDRFAGWERMGYNLKTHPEVFGPVLTK